MIPAALALLSAGSCAVISLMAFAGVMKTGWHSLISGLLAVFALVMWFLALKYMQGVLASLEDISKEAGIVSDTSIDLARLVQASSLHSKLDSMSGLDILFGLVNDDVASLQRSATKFDLFSSDILFSAQNLSDQAARQSDMLVSLREKTGGFFEVLTRTNNELGVLKGTIDRNADSAASLEQKARVSKDELNDIIKKSVDAAKEAQRGEAEVSSTSLAALELEAGLKKLNATAMRESEEAKHITTSLAVIADIVERTHILATNASIEAARAGERGAGFAVIAHEVRTLSASSRQALEEIGLVLNSVKKGIDDSSALTKTVSTSAARLSGSLDITRSSFDGIGAQVRDIEKRLASFDEVFSDQIQRAEETAMSARSAATTLSGFTEAYTSRSGEYDTIVSSSRVAESSAAEARRSARVLAQLASYLKAGGAERNRILRKYTVDQDSGLRSYGRKERREELLYNLEVYNTEDILMGYLGDLSKSGLLLLSFTNLEIGSKISISVALPISAEGERRVRLSIIVRRVEPEREGFRAGCSFSGTGDIDEASVDEILKTLALGNLSAPGNISAAMSPADVPDDSLEELEELSE